jgi:hypothetical protein
MFTNHKGTTTLEWVVIGALVILILGVISWTIATKANGEGASTGNWIDSINVPNAHP